MLQALQDVVNNPDLGEPFLILRNPGQFGPGGWAAGKQQQIKAYGVVSQASAKELDMIPEADRVHEARSFHSSTRMYVTSEDLSITSDILVWNGVKYRVAAALEYPQRGYYGAVALRMAGQ